MGIRVVFENGYLGHIELCQAMIYDDIILRIRLSDLFPPMSVDTHLHKEHVRSLLMVSLRNYISH